jgi:L-lactate dehydrogenase complex protein LldG
MSDAKQGMLERIRKAIQDVPETERLEDIPVNRTYRSSTGQTNLLELTAERIAEYRARVEIVTADNLASSIQVLLELHGIKRLIVPHDLPATWKLNGVELLEESTRVLEHAELERADGVLTGCTLAIAETGTLVLDHARGQGRRALTLIPDFHLCVLLESQIVDNLPAAMKMLEPSIRAGRPLTFISGPSATSDIELSRVEGVHGPRTLEVLIVKDMVSSTGSSSTHRQTEIASRLDPSSM